MNGSSLSTALRNEDWKGKALPRLLTVDETAALLRTTRKAIYAMVERRQLPGVVRVGRRILLDRFVLVEWLGRSHASSA